MAYDVWGLDFGTTNSLLTIVDRSGAVIHLTDETDRPHPSVIWYKGSETIVGRDARKHLDAGGDAISGDFVRSPKRLLDRDALHFVGGRELDARTIVAAVLRHLKDDAAQRPLENRRIERAVMTIPVKLDGTGRRRLREAAREAGISVVQFVHEPLAALYAHLRAQPDFRRRLAELDRCRLLVFDWGGGTLDLTLCEVVGDQIVQIDNLGDNDVGGDFFDDAIRNRVIELHARGHGVEDVASVERPESRIRLLNECELAKIALSERESLRVFVPNYLHVEGGARTLAVTVTRADVEAWTRNLVARGLGRIDQILERNGVALEEIALCLPTGGMVRMPAIRNGLLERFGIRAPRLTNGDRIISEGAAWIAHDGARLGLAKPIELLQPDGSYAPVVQLPCELPRENERKSIANLELRCVDPRTGRAHFIFARPRRLRAHDPRADREVYSTLGLRVDPNAAPLFERFALKMTMDHDYVAQTRIAASLSKDEAVSEIYDLEFTLRFPSLTAVTAGGSNVGGHQVTAPGEQAGPGLAALPAGSLVRIQSNISVEPDWKLVPGDLVARWQVGWFDDRARQYADWQKREHDYYKSCPFCTRSRYEFARDGCRRRSCLWRRAYPDLVAPPSESFGRGTECDERPAH